MGFQVPTHTLATHTCYSSANYAAELIRTAALPQIHLTVLVKNPLLNVSFIVPSQCLCSERAGLRFPLFFCVVSCERCGFISPPGLFNVRNWRPGVK